MGTMIIGIFAATHRVSPCFHRDQYHGVLRRKGPSQFFIFIKAKDLFAHSAADLWEKPSDIIIYCCSSSNEIVVISRAFLLRMSSFLLVGKLF
jgi:hypothetical protein